MSDFASQYARALKYGGSHTHADFHAKLHEDPDEKTTALVYADWLEENGQPHAAELIRRHGEQQVPGFYTDVSPTSTQIGGQFRGVLFDYAPEAHVMLAKNSDTLPGYKLKWLVKFKPEEIHEARRLLTGLAADGGELNTAASDLVSGNHRGLKSQEQQ